MTQQELPILKKNLITMSAMYGRQLDDSVIGLYANALKDYELKEVLGALGEIIKDSKIKTMPIIANILDKLSPVPTERDESVDLARRLESAIKKYERHWSTPIYIGGEPRFESGPGEYHERWVDAVETRLGTLGAAVVNRLGWGSLCDMYFEMDPGQFHAQIRDSIQAVIAKAKSGTLDVLPSLPESPNQKLNALVSGLADKKKLPEGNT